MTQNPKINELFSPSCITFTDRLQPKLTIERHIRNSITVNMEKRCIRKFRRVAHRRFWGFCKQIFSQETPELIHS